MQIFDRKEKKMSRKKKEEDKKPAYAFADILRGLQNAVSGAQDMLQAQQMQNLSAFWNDDGTPVCKKVKLGDTVSEIPLFVLVPHSQLSMSDAVIKFKTRIGNVEPTTLQGMLGSSDALTHADLQMEMSGVGSNDDDAVEVTITFKTKETPEAVSRLMDEYNKLI